MAQAVNDQRTDAVAINRQVPDIAARRVVVQ
jgi:hypothetical protein